MQRDTIFRIASMTKPVTVAAAMALIEEGKLALTDPVARWLPELADMRVLARSSRPAGQDRTCTSAHHNRRPDDPPQRAGLRLLGARTARPRLRHGCRSARIRTAGSPNWPSCRWRISPATRLTYSHATDVLGIALSRIEGKSLSDVLAERIFAPLGMVDTGFSVGTRRTPPCRDDVQTRRERRTDATT